jgi:hypothetical protein
MGPGTSTISEVVLKRMVALAFHVVYSFPALPLFAGGLSMLLLEQLGEVYLIWYNINRKIEPITRNRRIKCRIK